MRRVKIIAMILGSLLALHDVSAQENSVMAIELAPQVSLPVGRDVDVYSMGGGASVLARWTPSKLGFLGMELGGAASLVPVLVAEGKPVSSAMMSLYWPHVGLGLHVNPTAWLKAGAHASAGYFFASIDAPLATTDGSNPMYAAGVNLDFKLAKTFSLGIGAEYRNFLGLYNDLSVRLGTTYHIQPPRSGLAGKYRQYKDLVITGVELLPVFPVLFKYYDENPVGTVVVMNKGKIPIENLRVEFFVNQYMDGPKASVEIPFLKGGQEARIDVLALFNDTVLAISEATKVQATMVVMATVAGEQYGLERTETLRIHDRNAISWIDDRRVAAFVTAKDPSVMRFAKNVTSAVKGAGPSAFPESMLLAAAMHDALAAYGMSYQVDPSTPYTQLSKNESAVDYLQFPGQSLQFKAGDCDDLSILNAALLEALGVETAFITVPGHIYMAFALGIPPAEAARRFQRPGDIIVVGDKTWVPVEVTLTREGFLKAWETGAEEWRQAGAEARLYPVHEAWAVYEPVGFPGSGSSEPPDGAIVLDAFRKDIARLVDRELGPQEVVLKARLKTAQDEAKLLNTLGVLYARYGRTDKAEAQFKTVLAKREFIPALVNLANLRYMAADMDAARTLYARADKAQPRTPVVTLGLARASYELGDYAAAARYHAALKALDSPMAAAYSYLEAGSAAAATTRAADAEKPRKDIVWSE
jgi:hypothetical protein